MLCSAICEKGIAKIQKNIGMAEKKQANSYESIMKDLKAQTYFPVYILLAGSCGSSR